MNTPSIGDRWLSIREAAALIGPDMSHQRMRRRLLALDRQNPTAGLLRRPGKRWFEASAQVLERLLTTDPGAREADVDNIAAIQKKHDAQLQNHLMRIRALERGQKRTREVLGQLKLPGFDATTSA